MIENELSEMYTDHDALRVHFNLPTIALNSGYRGDNYITDTAYAMHMIADYNMLHNSL